MGDVVISAFVADKSNVHYQMPKAKNGDQDGPATKPPYEGVEVHAPAALEGADINSYDTARRPRPTPARTIRQYGPRFGPTSATSPAQASAPAGRGDRRDRRRHTGRRHRRLDYPGTITKDCRRRDRAGAGVDRPLSSIKAQNALYQTDAEENEETGFAYASAAQGIQSLIIRGYPTPRRSRMRSTVSSPPTTRPRWRSMSSRTSSAAVSAAPTTFSDLSPASNAAQAGYIVASQADSTVSPVGTVTYTNQQGVTQTIPNFQFSRLGAEPLPWRPPPAEGRRPARRTDRTERSTSGHRTARHNRGPGIR